MRKLRKLKLIYILRSHKLEIRTCLLNMGAQPDYSLLSDSEDELLPCIKTTSTCEMRFFHKGIWLDVILILAISSSLIAITSIHGFDDLWWCTSPKTVRYTNVAAWFILSRFIVATEKFFPDQPAVRYGQLSVLVLLAFFAIIGRGIFRFNGKCPV